MVELARSLRSGVVESRHDGAAVAVDAGGRVIASWGDPTERSFYRSAIKPFQATAVLESGVDLAPEHLALACASHEAQPVHVAIVAEMLARAGLDESALGTPPAMPSSPASALRLAAAGSWSPRPLFHNCSGKHAAFLTACVVNGWPRAGYLEPAHPMQAAALAVVSEASEDPITPVGVDGCGAPAPTGTILGLARAFAKLTSDARYDRPRDAMSRFPSLISTRDRPDALIGAWLGGPVKRGAKGMIAASRHGVGVAVKSREGSGLVAAVGLVSVLRALGMLSDAAYDALRDVAAPPVVGGGARVGALEPAITA
jgi:L-asparaginase II